MIGKNTARPKRAWETIGSRYPIQTMIRNQICKDSTYLQKFCPLFDMHRPLFRHGFGLHEGTRAGESAKMKEKLGFRTQKAIQASSGLQSLSDNKISSNSPNRTQIQYPGSKMSVHPFPIAGPPFMPNTHRSNHESKDSSFILTLSIR